MSDGVDVIIGHEAVLKSLEQALYNKKFAHAHLFFGEDGIGKSVLATYIGKVILGGKQQRDYVDLIKCDVFKNKKSISVDQVRQLIEEVNKKPFEGDKKVIIVHNVNKMTEQAQNAFLKTIEEPPKGVYIFLLCENLGEVLDTIQSRCQIHKLEPLNYENMRRYILKQYNKIDENKMKLAIAFGNGIPGKVDKFLNDKDFSDTRQLVFEFLLKIKGIDKIQLLEYENVFNNYGNNREDLFQCFLSTLRDAIVYKETGNHDLLINIDKTNEVEKLCTIFSLNQLNHMVKIVVDSMESLKYNLNSSLVFTDMLIKIQEA
ncbi:DNA polymerase-3 subunit delta' [Hathewaya proteolytica DSM 3090]|uniref:DNA polymerase III subunit delta' n=1 Tax=Hathewaya proteolytica DSM 3090 TaxID=1121331 RepID=A0A1M6T3S2_9CLOT|nr:DNA polymerase III subunit delta' [Hathewaya proteolytica]SHK51536.1 DNA polymerase-3 subunit delta' [Hathewaya proteolytica DSM 3090]